MGIRTKVGLCNARYVMRYTQEQVSTALVLLKAIGSPDKVIQTLGYPSTPILYHWRKKYPKY